MNDFLIPFPEYVDNNGVPWYYLDMLTGVLYSFRPRYRQPAKSAKRLPFPKAISGSGKYGILEVMVPGKGGQLRRTRYTRKAIIIRSLEAFWAANKEKS